MIDYTFEITNVDTTAKCMVVLYRADGFDDITVGTRLPLVNETIDQVVIEFAPIKLWEEQTFGFQIPVVGTSGQISSEPEIIEPVIVTIPVERAEL